MPSRTGFCHHTFTGHPSSWESTTRTGHKKNHQYAEKWEGPCWYDSHANLTMNPPVERFPVNPENYQLKTIKQAKEANPKLSAIFYIYYCDH
jgi:hypothetical protein